MKAALILIAVTFAHLTAQVRPLRPPPAPEEQTGKASIEGSVVDALTHEPVKKASVMLNGRMSLTAVTDASGQFAFRQLPAGQYSVQAQSNRYPIGRLGGDLARQTSITVAGDEQKRDVTLSLTPGASVRGRIVDEEGNPMPQCTVSAMQRTTSDNGQILVNASGVGHSDENGEYRISSLPAGKYYLMASCPQTFPMPHAFIRRGPAADLPMLVYVQLLYPGTADPSGAARIEAQLGGLLAGIDFRMMPATGVTVRGRARPSSFDRNLQVFLQPTDVMRRGLGNRGARINSSTGEFQIANVQPGSYELVAWGIAENQSYFAQIPVEVGASAPDPIELLLAPGSRISGTLLIEGDAKQPPNPSPIHVTLNPAANQPIFGPPPQAEVKSDGAFVFESVKPGRWRVQLNGPGYVKSVALGDQEISGDEIEITAAAAPLKIVMGTKYTQLAVSVSPPPAGVGPLTGLAWATTSSIQQNFGLDSQGMGNLSVPPGRYHVCGLVEAQPWMVMQNRALRKAVEDRCATVDVLEGGPQKVQISLISSEELKRIVDSLDE
jgi:Carboxypeptidase regulatory-like domain